MNNVRRTERGWLGHFIGGRDCMFRRNTLLEHGDTRVVVSTVGNYTPRGRLDTIGHERHFETMAFMAEWDGAYWDANVSREVVFQSPWSIFGVETSSDQKANDMHESAVWEIEELMRNGLLKERE